MDGWMDGWMVDGSKVRCLSRETEKVKKKCVIINYIIPSLYN